jgi:hypothetical protein
METTKRRGRVVELVAAFAFLACGCGSSDAQPGNAGGAAGGVTDAAREVGDAETGAQTECARAADGGLEGDAPATDVDTACTSYAKARCAHDLACRVRDFRRAYGPPDVCVTRMTRVCTDEASACGSLITPAALTQCAQTLQHTECPAGVLKPIAECAFTGTMPDGAACRYASQCQSGYCESSSTSAWCGVCRSQVGIGAPCQSQLACAGDSVVCTNERKCAAQIPEGGACKTANFDCALDFVCSPSNLCEKAGTAGAACGSAGDCSPEEPLGCADEGAGRVCTNMAFAGYGEPCDDAVPAICMGSGDCRAADGTLASMGTCSPPASDGEACNLTSDTGRGCLPPSLCVKGVCEFPPGASACVTGQ